MLFSYMTNANIIDHEKAQADYRIYSTATGWFMLKEISTGSTIKMEQDREKVVAYARRCGLRLLNP